MLVFSQEKKIDKACWGKCFSEKVRRLRRKLSICTCGNGQVYMNTPTIFESCEGRNQGGGAAGLREFSPGLQWLVVAC